MLDNIAIIAGSGKLPIKIAYFLKKKKCNFIFLAIKGFSKVKSNKDFRVYRLGMGEGRKAINLLRQNKISRIIFLGGLDRPNLINLKPDLWTLFKVFKFIFFKKTDDVILRNVASIFENEGFNVIGLSHITNKFFLRKGVYGSKKVSNKDMVLINNLLKKTLLWTKKDLGQSVITSKSDILLKENRKGTNELITRCLNKKKINKNSYLFIKLKKLNQDNRVDLPTFGLETAKKLVKTNIKYIVLNADYTVIMDKKETLKYLKKHKIIVISANTTLDFNNKK